MKLPNEAAELLIMKSSTFEINCIVALGREFPLEEAIKINVTKDEEYYLSASKRFSIHGTGDTVEDAITDYMEEFIRYFDWLTRTKLNLLLSCKRS